VNLLWGDVDFAGLRLRLARAKTKPGKKTGKKPGKKTGKSMSLDVYSHVMRADEVSDKCLLALIEP
jgi:hypothetical protein